MKKSELVEIIKEELDALKLKKVLESLELVNPLHLKMTDNGRGQFPDGYKLTKAGVDYIIKKLEKL